MLRRLFLVFLPSLTASVSFANQASWNCEQNKDSKEWVCIGDSKPGVKTGEAAPPVKHQSIMKVQPALTRPLEKMPPVKTQPVQVTQPAKPKSVARVQPNQKFVTEPVKSTQPGLSAFQKPAPKVTAPVASSQPVMSQPVRVTPPVTAKSVDSTQAVKPVPVQVKQAVVTQPVKRIQITQPAPQKTPVESSKLPGEEASRPGWNCDAGKGAESWNCQLTGADPKGAVQPVATSEPMGWLLNPAFDHQQEQIFSTLTSQLKYDPWENCSVEVGTKRDFVPEADQRAVSPLDVKSNYAEVFDNEIGSYSGNVKIARADQQASSNSANYDSVSEVLDLHGNVYYSEDELALSGQSVTLNLASDQAKLRDVQFISPATPLRGRAGTVYRDSKTLSRYRQVAYTTCQPGNQDWVAHASELKLNKTTGRGSAKNTWIEFKGVPVFYSPYLSFPIDNRRLSGFLAPVFGSTQNGGFNLSTPYYWNIAPNYDATLTPRYLTKRGALLAGKFRYLTEQSRGTVGVEVMPNDNETNAARYLGSIKNVSQFTPHISSVVDLNYVSDKTYFAELGNALSFPNFSFLRSNANISYAGQGVSLIGQVENYQAINETITDADLPYRKLPQINLNLDHAFKFMPLYTAMDNEFVYFQHSDNVTSVNGQSVNRTPSGQRVNTRPSVSLPLQTAGAFFTPKLSLQHTSYFLSNIETRAPDSTSRTLPLISVDSGLFFERDLDIASTSFLHTIEPRLFYLYVPYTNQQDIPVFDSAEYDFSFNSMFRENSFSGTDRIQNANQITTAITSRLVDSKTGRDTLKLSVGEIFYFRDREVTLQYAGLDAPLYNRWKNLPLYDSNFSNLVTELTSELTDHISVGTGLQWNPDTNDVERGHAVLHYRHEPDELINVGYLYRQNPRYPDPRSDDIIQTDMSFRWPIYDNWYALGRWQYSLLYNTTQEGFFGLEKENCCWRFRIIGRHWINNINTNTGILAQEIRTAEGDSQNGVFFQVELKGLTGIGEKLDTFFEKNLYGYRKPQ